MKNKKIALAMILTAVISVSATYAALLIAHEITTTMIVRPTISMGVFDTDGVTPLIRIDLGEWTWGTTKNFPGGTSEIPTEFYYINNTDQLSFYVAFYFEGLPQPSGWSVRIRRGDQSEFTTTAGAIYPFAIESPFENPDPATQYAVWYLSIGIQNIPFDTYNPTLTIKAYDSASG